MRSSSGVDELKGLFSLAVGYYCTITQVVKAPKEAFVPRPKVDSIVLRLDLREKKPVDLKSEKLFFEVIRSGFGQTILPVISSE